MVRRLFITLILWTCLLGMIQPTLACGLGTDCCPKGSASTHVQQATLSAVEDASCCTAQPALASSPLVVAQPRKALDRAAGSPSLFVAPATVPTSRSVPYVASIVLTDFRGDSSLTYLHTARLRL